jgi:hypothetical protein
MNMQSLTAESTVINTNGWKLNLQKATEHVATITTHFLSLADVSNEDITTAVTADFDLKLIYLDESRVVASQRFLTTFGLDEGINWSGVVTSASTGKEFAYFAFLIEGVFYTELDFSVEAIQLQRERMED